LSRSDHIELTWASRKLAKTCADAPSGRRAWGADNWRLLQRRLASLAAAPTLADMDGVPGRCHQLHADRDGMFAVTLWGGYRLVFEPDHDPVPRIFDGGIDRTKVTGILIKEVVNYHGD